MAQSFLALYRIFIIWLNAKIVPFKINQIIHLLYQLQRSQIFTLKNHYLELINLNFIKMLDLNNYLLNLLNNIKIIINLLKCYHVILFFQQETQIKIKYIKI